MTVVETHEATLTFEQTLELMFPEPHGLLRLIAHGFHEKDYFFKNHARRWHWPVGAPHGSADTPSAVLARTEPDVQVRVSPLLYTAPSDGAPAILPVLWCAFDVGLGASTTGLGQPINPASARTVAATVRALNPALLIDEGSRMIALYRLAKPLRDMDEAARVLTALAVKHGGDRRACDPSHETFAIPGQRMVGVFPTQHVTAHVVNDHDVELEQLL